jgi:endo-1,4-beta-xylanase
MNAHIDALMTHYPNIPYWDVVNEAIDDGAMWRSTFWHDTIGDDFIDLAFQRARAADPDAKLFYNDYNVEQLGNAKADRMFNMIKDMRARGIPIDGAGLQSHYFVGPPDQPNGVPDMNAIKANIARYAEIGVEVHITECDFRLVKPLDQAKTDTQTKFFADLFQICADAPNCTHFTVWGLSDIDSWVPSTFPEMDYAHLYDANFMPRASYQAMTQVLAKYNADGTPVGSGSGSEAAKTEESGGCAITAAGSHGETGWSAALLGLLGVSMLSRRTAKRRG